MGTSEIYGIQKKIPFDVKEKPNPMSPYGVTKYASELISILKSKQTKLDLLCLRPFNTLTIILDVFHAGTGHRQSCEC